MGIFSNLNLNSSHPQANRNSIVFVVCRFIAIENLRLCVYIYLCVYVCVVYIKTFTHFWLKHFQLPNASFGWGQLGQLCFYIVCRRIRKCFQQCKAQNGHCEKNGKKNRVPHINFCLFVETPQQIYQKCFSQFDRVSR